MSAAAFGKQGITSILAPDCGGPKTPSLRRTLSADMSSRNWIAQNGLIFLSEEHRLDDITDSPIGCPEDEEGEETQFDIRNSIREESTRNKAESEKARQSSIWSSILSEKTTDPPVPAETPYIHPLVKRSKNSLSKKSLEVCTESLGSETGSDGFSSYPSSETGEGEEDKEEFTEESERSVSADSILIGKKRQLQLQQLTRSRSFPPPLPSLSRQNGASLHVLSHRDNGRLVLEAVTVKEQNNFRAQREDGRLVLTFIDDPSSDHDDSDEIVAEDESDMKGDRMVDFGDEDDERGEEISLQEKDVETDVAGEEMPHLSTGEVSANKLAFVMNKPAVVLADRNPALSSGFGEFVIFGGSDDEETVQMQPSLCQLTELAHAIAKQPTVSATSYYNTYEYFWRPESASLISRSTEKSILVKSYNNNNNYIISRDATTSNEKRELVVVRGNDADYLVPFIQSCKDTRRSLLFLGPRCIATS